MKNHPNSECRNCKKQFRVEPARLKNGRGKYCCKKCYSLSMIKADKKSRAKINSDYRKSHPLKYKLWKHNRRMLQKKLGGSFNEIEWTELVKKHNNRCALCNKNNTLTIDHIIPITKWNEWKEKNNPTYLCGDIQNIQPLCRSCNSKKNNNVKI